MAKKELPKEEVQKVQEVKEPKAKKLVLDHYDPSSGSPVFREE